MPDLAHLPRQPGQHPVRPVEEHGQDEQEAADRQPERLAVGIGGRRAKAGGQAALLRWLLENDAGSLARSATAFSAKDALLHRLTGARVTDFTDASAPFLDLRSRTYDEELIDLLRLRPIRSLLPALDTATGSLWPVSARGAELTGLPEGMAVHAGPFDAIATGLGAGLGPPIAGRIFDVTGGYSLFLLLGIAQGVLSGMSVFRLGPYPKFQPATA